MITASLFGGGGNVTGTGGGGEIPPPADTKNLQPMPWSQNGKYNFPAEFVPVWTGGDRISLIYREADDHLNVGKIKANHITPSTMVMGTPFLLYQSPTKQLDDPAVGYISAESKVIYTQVETDHGITTWDMHPFYQKLNVGDFTTSGGRVAMTGGATGITQLQYEWFFGQLPADPDVPNKYYGSLIQMNIDVATGGDPIGQVRQSCVVTTDNWATWTRHEVFATTTIGTSEMIVLPLGGGKLIALRRLDGGGPWYQHKSSDSGVTWTAVNPSNLNWQASREKIVKGYQTESGLWDFLITDRDTGWMMISRQNDFFGPNNTFNTAVYNTPELYHYNYTGDSHTGLGYGSQINLDSTTVLRFFHKEASNNLSATVMYTRDDNIQTTSPAQPPSLEAPSGFITSSAFLVRIVLTGYTQAQLDNIDYFEWDVAVDSSYGSFKTGRYYYTQVSGVTLQNIRAQAHFLSLDMLGSGQAHFVRVRARNKVGSSFYTALTVTTL